MKKKKIEERDVVEWIYKYMEYLRENKDYEWADAFRDLLIKLGYEVRQK